MRKQFRDTFAGVPGGYFLREDGTAMNALGVTIPVKSDAELRQYAYYANQPSTRSVEATAPAAVRVIATTGDDADEAELQGTDATEAEDASGE